MLSIGQLVVFFAIAAVVIGAAWVFFSRRNRNRFR
jgi:hypothetical protein